MTRPDDPQQDLDHAWQALTTDDRVRFQERLRVLLHLERIYKGTWILEDIDATIQLARDTLMLAKAPIPHRTTCAHALDHSNDHSNLDIATCCLVLADALNARFYETCCVANIEEQIKICEELEYSTRSDGGLHMRVLICLGVGLRTRASVTAATASKDLERAQELHRDAVQRCSVGTNCRITALSELGETLTRTHDVLQDSATLEEAETSLRKALALCSTASPVRNMLLYRLGFALSYRSFSAEESQQLLEKALPLMPARHPDRPTVQRILGQLRIFGYEMGNKLSQEMNATSTLLQALDDCAMLHPDRAKILVQLSDIHRLKQNKDRLRATNMSIDFAQQALAACKPSHPHFYKCLATIAVALATRGAEFDSLEDLEAAISYQRQCVQLCQPESELYPQVLNNLALIVLKHSTRSGDRTLAEEAVRLLRQVAAVGPSRIDGPAWPLVLSNLGYALHLLAQDTHDALYYEESIHIHEEAVSASSPSEVRYSDYLCRLADALESPLEHAGDLTRLDRAVQLREELVKLSLTGNGQPHLLSVRVARTLCIRFVYKKNIDDFERAASILSNALATTLPDDRDQQEIMLAVARLHLINGGTHHFNPHQALRLVKEVLLATTDCPQRQLLAALDVLHQLENVVAEISYSVDLQQQIFETYQIAISFLSRSFYFGLDARARLEALYKAKDLAICGARYGLPLAKLEEAVELLEEGRAVFLAQYTRLRTFGDRLPPELAHRLKIISQQLDEKSMSGNDVDKTAERRVLTAEWEALVATARSIPTFERFLLPGKFEYLSQAAAKRPVIIFIPGHTLSYAVLISCPYSAAHLIELPNLTTQRLEELEQKLNYLNDKGRAMESRAISRRGLKRDEEKPLHVYSVLWIHAMLPVISALKLQKPDGKTKPRISVCPTGVFTRLPIHAAGIYSSVSSADYGSAYCVVSYTPTLETLCRLNGLGPLPRSNAKLLLAAVPAPFKWGRLPHTVHEMESIRSVVSSDTLVELPGRSSLQAGAAAGNVLERLPDATFLHLACHGYQDTKLPLQSGFIMSDRTLNLSEVLATRLPKAFLAFLSACETARGDERQPDQVLHLAAAMLVAGFRSVIGTMWSMGDKDGPEVAVCVYKELFATSGEYFDPDTIPYALDAAVQELRLKGCHPSRWATYVHLGV